MGDQPDSVPKVHPGAFDLRLLLAELYLGSLKLFSPSHELGTRGKNTASRDVKRTGIPGHLTDYQASLKLLRAKQPGRRAPVYLTW